MTESIYDPDVVSVETSPGTDDPGMILTFGYTHKGPAVSVSLSPAAMLGLMSVLSHHVSAMIKEVDDGKGGEIIHGVTDDGDLTPMEICTTISLVEAELRRHKNMGGTVH